MFRALCVVLIIIAAAFTSELAGQERDHEVDKTIELTQRDGKLEFIERGKDQVAPITIVVGQRIRWENKDNEPHTVVSTMSIAGKPLFSTGIIKPGDHKEVLFDIDLYQRAGGRPANVVTVQYHSDERLGEPGEIRLLSAARR
jgi:plastocyanin